MRIVEHSGSTAGYSAHLLRMPDEHLSVAVLCNATTARATEYAHEVADLYLPRHENTVPAPAKPLPTSLTASGQADVWRSVDNGMLGSAPAGSTWTVDGNRLTVTDRYGVDEAFERVAEASPSAEQLRALAGTYTSDEAETTLTVAVQDGALTIKRRPDAVFGLTPLYADAFRAPQFGTVVFRRNASGAVTALSVVDGRVWDLRFARQPRSSKSTQ